MSASVRTGRPPTRIRHDSQAGTWERIAVPPGAPLHGLVERLQGYRQQMPPSSVHRAMPSPTLPLIITLGPGHVIRDRDGAADRVASFVAGPHDRHVFVEAEAFVGLQVDLTPVGAHRLLGVPLRELTNRVVALDDLLGATARRLVDDLACAPGWEARMRRVVGALHERLRTGTGPDPRVAHAWHRLADSGGMLPIGPLADELGWSRRHLTARFTEQLGLSPKRAARLIRFDRAARLLTTPDGPPIAEVALAVGCYDQAHLANEVREHCGLSPSQLRARSLDDAGGVWEPAGP